MKLMTVETLPSGNKHLLNPLALGEKVIVVEDIEGDQYIKIRHNKGLSYSRFHRDYFASLGTSKNKEN